VVQGYPIDVVYLDIQKAFDKVPHNWLMLRVDLIEVFKILKVLMTWILIYLLNFVKHIQEVTL